MVETGVTTFNLNLREGAALDQPVKVVLTKGTQLSILRNLGDWLEVRTPDGLTGFVSSQFVDILPPDEPEPAPPTRLVTATGVFINVRGTPMIAPDNLIGQIDAGVALTPLEDDAAVLMKVGTLQEQNLWLRVRLPDGREGFVAAWLLRLVEPPSPERRTDETRDNDRDASGALRVPIESLRVLYEYIDTIPDDQYPLPQSYHDFWAHRETLGLPDPFDVSPTQPGTYDHKTLMVNGFGPNTFAFLNWSRYYNFVCGMHNGLDHIVPLGTPLLAVSDGIIVGTQAHWQFMASKYEKSLVLWCYLPDSIRDAQGRRMLSNVLVAYAHMSDNTSFVKRHDEVKAGQVIGLSGHPVNVARDGSPAPETGNAHLHLEVHLLSGDNNLPRPIRRNPGLLRDYTRAQPFDTNTPFNPLLFFSPRMVKYHMHQGKKIGYAGGPTYPSAQALSGAGLGAFPQLDFFSIGCYQYGRDHIIWRMTPPWGSGIYDLDTLLRRIQVYERFEPYPVDFV